MRISPQQSLIDWTGTKHPLTKGLFREMCLEIFGALRLERQREPTPGAFDSLAASGKNGSSRLLVDCCLIRDPSSLDVDRLYRLHSTAWDLGIETGVLALNIPVPGVLLREVRRLCESSTEKPRVGVLDGKSIENFLICLPKIYKKFFSTLLPPLPEDIDCNKIRSADVSCQLESHRESGGLLEGLKVCLANVGPQSTSVEVITGQGRTTVDLGPFSVETLALSTEKERDLQGLEVVGVDGPVLVDRKELPTSMPRIDQIFVDPAGRKEQVVAALKTGAPVCVVGGPGSGKSRLLRESCCGFPTPLWVDLSQRNYEIGLLEHLVESIFRLRVAAIRSLGEELVADRLQKGGCSTIDADTLARHLCTSEGGLPEQALLKALVGLATAVCAGRLIVIDNIHALRHFDAEFLRALLSRDLGMQLAFSAREQEMQDLGLASFLWQRSKERGLVRIDLDQTPSNVTIRDFLQAAAVDAATRQFLAPLSASGSMQEFVIALKNLKAHKLIRQQPDGRIVAEKPKEQLRLAEYKEIVRQLMAVVVEERDSDLTLKALQAAAAFGFTFDYKFLEEVVGVEAEEVLEQLESVELILPAATLEDAFRFDHELTHEIIYGSIPSLSRRRWHRRLITYLKRPENYKQGEVDFALARHHEQVGQFGEGAERSIHGGRYLADRGQLSEARDAFHNGVRLAEELRLRSSARATDERSYTLEAEALEGLIEMKYDLVGPKGCYDRVRQLDALMLLHPSSGTDRRRLEGRVAFFFARHHNLMGDNEKAQGYIEQAVDLLGSLGPTSELGEAICRQSTIEKNCGRFERAAETALQARSVFAEVQDQEGLSLSYLIHGAASLEKGDYPQTIESWRSAVKVVSGTRAEQALCLAQVDYAAILALADPEATNAEDELLRAVHLSSRLAMSTQETRALLNLANWQFFHAGLADPWPTIEKVLNMARLAHNEYMKMLCHLALYNTASEERELRESAAHLERLVCAKLERLQDGKPIADNRLLVALKVIEQATQRGHLPSVNKCGTPAEISARVDVYRRGDRYITIY